MFKDNLLFCEKHEEVANQIVSAYQPGINIINGLVVVIFGGAGTGKSEVAWWLSRKLYCKNFSSHILGLDRFYKVPVEEREATRKTTLEIGPNEIDFERVADEVELFYNNDHIDVLIIEGLYAGYIPISNLRVYLSGDLDSTYEFRKRRGKENPDSDWRKFVIQKEQEAVVKSLKDGDEIYTTL